MCTSHTYFTITDTTDAINVEKKGKHLNTLGKRYSLKRNGKFASERYI
jgi:hypothetical protein